MSIGVIGADLLSARWVIQIVVTLTIPIFLLGHRLPHREDSLVRGIIAIAGLSAGMVYPVAAGYITGLDAEESFLVFSLLLGVYALLLLWVFDASLWQTLFCATAGYTLQNLASGLEVLIQSSSRTARAARSPNLGTTSWDSASRLWSMPLATWCLFDKSIVGASPWPKTSPCSRCLLWSYS